MAKFLNLPIITCMFILLFSTHGTRGYNCDDNDIWVRRRDPTTCDDSDYDHLRICGEDCRSRIEAVFAIGNCRDDTCHCCVLNDPWSWYKNRLYATPCDEEKLHDSIRCLYSCAEQDADIQGDCKNDVCMCIRVDEPGDH